MLVTLVVEVTANEVEVTAKDSGPLTASTIRNTLDSKRNQVQSNAPAILYVQIPSEWAAESGVAGCRPSVRPGKHLVPTTLDY